MVIQDVRNEMKKRSQNIVFGAFASFGYLLLIAHFGLLAFANSFGRPPNPRLASFDLIILVICVWRLFCSVRRVFKRKTTEDEEFQGTG